MSKRAELTGTKHNKLTVIRFDTEQKAWYCRCDCGGYAYATSYELTHGVKKSCEDCRPNARKNLEGEIFGDWKVIKYLGDGKWECKCSCGNSGVVSGYDLTHNKSKSCGHSTTRFIDLTGQQFGEWKAVKYLRDQKWECICSCGNKGIVRSQDLVDGKSKSCGHSTNKKYNLVGQKFGEWTVIEHREKHMCLCECSCENKTRREIYINSLLDGKSKSCGCKKGEFTKNTLLTKYGDYAQSKSNMTREKWQIDAISSEQNMRKFLESLDKIPTTAELGHILGIAQITALRYTHKFNLEEYVNIDPGYSQGETEVYEFICSIINEKEIIRKDMSTLGNYEIDIYIPSKKLGIEYNGSYWHSTIKKHKDYHKNKTIAGAKKGIRIIHIFDYEWANENTRKQLKQLLTHIITKSTNRVYARDTEVVGVKLEELVDFLNINHLQGYAHSTVNLGLRYNGQLIGVMTFGKPRFDNTIQYELIRLAWDSNTTVVGGAEKLFAHFVKTYTPNSIVTYCNVAKFTGNVYPILGFEPLYVTEPNYVWVNTNTLEVFSRYQTMKQKLVAEGLGDESQTENEIMENLGFLKVYDSGNLKLIWNNNLTEV